jgi:hypothetical protein
MPDHFIRVAPHLNNAAQTVGIVKHRITQKSAWRKGRSQPTGLPVVGVAGERKQYFGWLKQQIHLLDASDTITRIPRYWETDPHQEKIKGDGDSAYGRQPASV